MFLCSGRTAEAIVDESRRTEVLMIRCPLVLFRDHWELFCSTLERMTLQSKKAIVLPSSFLKRFTCVMQKRSRYDPS